MKRTSLLTCALAAAVSWSVAAAGATDTLERIRAAGRIAIGYRTDARPFAYKDGSGSPAGYSIALCRKVADAVKTELNLPGLDVDWVVATQPDGLAAVGQGTIDLMCGADSVTLRRRKEVAFSIPIFPGGVAALLRSDAPVRLRDVLSGRGQSFQPTWRASASQVLKARAFSAVMGTTAEKWLVQRIDDLQVATTISPVTTYEAGVDAVLTRKVDALFGERAIVLEAARRRAGGRDLVVLDRQFTHEPLALTLPPNDDRFRLLVDRTLSRLYASGEIGALYSMWFGEPDETAAAFFRWNALPE
jgi:ABC-type amino acid transport substrate-binding protein